MINPARNMNNIQSALFRTTLIEEKKSSVIRTLKDDSHQLYLAIKSWNRSQTSTFPVSSRVSTESHDQQLSFEPLNTKIEQELKAGSNQKKHATFSLHNNE
jgi:hypothetical protein